MNLARNIAANRLFLAVLFSFLSVVLLESAAVGDLLNAPISGAGRKLFNSFDDFKARSGFVFRSDKEAAKAFEVYQNAGKAQKGIVIGHDLDPINQGYKGWQAFRMKADDWTYEINMSWIDGAVDAGKPVLIATPYDKIKVGSITWQEMMRVINRGGKVVFER